MVSETRHVPGLGDLERVLISEERLERRVTELATEISRDYNGRDLVLVSVLKGGIVFLADLIRRMTIPHQIELVGASSYHGGSTPAPSVRITKDVDQNLAGKDVLLIEDIYDSGNTLGVVHELLEIHRPASLEVCALLRKNKPRERKLEIKYVGFDIEDAFVVGYGLDFKERYRNLPCIGVLHPSMYQ